MKNHGTNRHIFWAVLALIFSVGCAQRAGTPTSDADLGITPTPTPKATATTGPTATPDPTPTPTAEPISYVDVVDGSAPQNVVDGWEMLIYRCETLVAPASAGQGERLEPAGTRAAVCGEKETNATINVKAVADARVVQIGRVEGAQEAVESLKALPPPAATSISQWRDAGLLGSHLVLDLNLPPEADTPSSPKEATPTPNDGTTPSEEATIGEDTSGEAPRSSEPTSVQVVYGGLQEIPPDLELGQRVDANTAIGMATNDTLVFGVWVDGVRQDNATAIATDAPGADEQQRIANLLAPLINPPTDPKCGLITTQGRIPGAERSYRNGVHQGIDFTCTGDDNEVTAVADGTVVYLIDDYQDATPSDRDTLLARAKATTATPFWTLAMLYGNVVVVDHGDLPDIGRVVTISAHLDSVADDIKLGGTVTQDQVLGIVGTTGTSASAEGKPHEDDPAQHLHWELFIDGWYLGQGLDDFRDVQAVIKSAVCQPGSPDCA